MVGFLLAMALLSSSAVRVYAVDAGANVPARTVAVLDFTMDASTNGVVDWASGAADLLEVELARQGVELLERRQIRLILGERRNYRSGMLAPDSLQAEGIPRPRAFLSGRFTRTGEKQFTLQAKLVSVQDGTDMAVAVAEGDYPKDWMSSLCLVATNLVSAIPGLSHATARKDWLPGASRNPEAAAGFYRSLAFVTKGRTEEAWASFHQVRMADPGFLLAEAWEIRALDACGLPEHAAIIRERLARHPAGILVLGMTAASQLKSRGNVVWILDEEPSIPKEWIRKLQQGLQTYSRVRFFDPARVGDLAREADLQLSGEMADRCPDATAWMCADGVLRVRALAGGLTLSLHDVASGRVLVSAEASTAQPPAPELLSILVSAGVTGTNLSSSASVVAQSASMPDNRFAQALWKYRQNPDNPGAVFGLSQAFKENGGDVQESGRHCRILLERLARQLASPAWRDSPDIALWRAVLQINRYEAEAYSRPLSRGESPAIKVSLSEVFKPVLDQYPTSLAANMARYAVAQELRLAGKHKEASALLEQVWKDLSTGAVNTNAVNGTDLDEYRANVGFALASESGACGNTELALDVIGKALGIACGHSNGPILVLVPVPEPGATSWGIRKFERRTSSLRHFQRSSVFGNTLYIRPEMEQLAERLRSAPGRGSTTPTLTPTMLLDKASASSGRAAIPFYIQFLEQSLNESKDGAPPYPEFFNVLAWLHLERLPVEDVIAVSNIVNRAAGRLTTGQYRYRLFAACGQPDIAAPALQEWVAAAPTEEGFASLCEYATFLSIVDSPTASRAMLQRECARLIGASAVPGNEKQRLRSLRLGEFSQVLANSNLPDEIERLWRMAKSDPLCSPAEILFWAAVTAYLRGDVFLATEDLRSIVENIGKTSSNPFVENNAKKLLNHLRNYSSFLDIATTMPAPPALDRRAAERALQLHMESKSAKSGRYLYWREQALRHLAETGSSGVSVWSRLIQHPCVSSCRCDNFVGIRPPSTNNVAMIVRPLERLIVGVDPSWTLQCNAPVALGHLGARAADSVPVLIALTSEANAAVNAKWALGKIGRPAVQCAPRLAMLLKHPNDEVRLRAAKALASMDGMPPDVANGVPDADLSARMLAWWESDKARKFKTP